MPTIKTNFPEQWHHSHEQQPIPLTHCVFSRIILEQLYLLSNWQSKLSTTYNT
jgi:hypothetical protein